MDLLVLPPATVVHVRGSGPLARAIRWSTRLPGEDATESNHVGLVLEGGLFAEAIWAGPRIGPSSELLAGRGEIRVAVPLNLNAAQTATICSSARRLVDRALGYGQLKIGIQALDSIFSKVFRRNVVLFRRLSRLPRWPICSSLVAAAYFSADLDFGVRHLWASPDDILDFQIAHPDIYDIGPWEPAHLLPAIEFQVQTLYGDRR